MRSVLSYLVVLFATYCVLAGCAWRLKVRPTTEHVSVLVTSGLDCKTLPLQAAAVHKARSLGPTIWFVVGEVLNDTLWSEMSEAEVQVRLLNAAGVDAVLMGPEWLRYGGGRVRTLVDIGRFYLLAANIVDTVRQTVGHEFMLRQFGGIVLGATGLCFDSSAIEFLQSGVMFLSPSYVAPKLTVVLRQRADVRMALMGEGAYWQQEGEYHLIVAPSGNRTSVLAPSQKPEMIAWYDLSVAAGAVSTVGKEVALDGYKPVSAVTRVCDSIASAIDSQAALVVAESQVVLSPSVLTRILARTLLVEQQADFVVFDTLGIEAIKPGIITQGMICRNVSRIGRLVVLDLEGRRVRDLLRVPGRVVERRHGIRTQRLAMRRTYTVLTSTEFVRRNPELARCRYQMIATPPWRIMASVLRRESGL
ncbi:MAG: hypothetical protein ABIK43_04815 [candidate division WOR-3 bacterium]